MTYIDLNVPEPFECGFQSNINFENYKYNFKYEYGDHGKRCIICCDDRKQFLEWFYTLPKEQRKFYEFVRSNDIVAEYYDIDMKLYNKDIDPEQYSFEIIKLLLQVRNEFAFCKLSNKDLIVLSAHTHDKLSLHIISKKTYFKNNRLQSAFAGVIFNNIKTETTAFNIDMSVYSNNRCFRMYQNHKYGKDNDLIVFAPHVYNFATMEETLVVLTHSCLDNKCENVEYDEELVDVISEIKTEEVFDDYLKECLRNFLTEYPYLRAEYTNNSINRINRIEHTTRPCLTDPTDKHSTENMFWYVKNNGLYVSCFCKKGTPILVAMKQGVSHVDVKPEKFTLATHTSDSFQEYKDLGPFKTIFDKRITGKGKTTCAMKYASYYKKVLLIHHRLSLDSDYLKKYPEFSSYQKNINQDKQTVCFNSLHKIDIYKYDLIIIDEVRSVLKQSEMKNMMYSTHVLFNIFENTDTPLIMLDANMTENDIHFITEYRKDEERIVIHDPITLESINKSIHLVKANDGREEVIRRMKQQVEQNKKVVLIYNIAIANVNAILNLFEDKRILHINRLTRKQENMDTDTWFDEYDVIAYSPTISEGVSIVDQRFKDVTAFGLFISSSSPAESASQMIARFRAIEQFIIHVDIKPKNSPLYYSEAHVLSSINNNLDLILKTSRINIQRQNGYMSVIDDEFCKLYCKNVYEKSIDYHYYEKTLVQKLINNGYIVYEDYNSDTDESLDKFEIFREKEEMRIKTSILSSVDLSMEDYNTIRDIGVSNEEEHFKIKKYEIIQGTMIKPKYITMDIIDQYLDSVDLYQLKNLRYCIHFMRNERGELKRISADFLIKNYATSLVSNLLDRNVNFLDQKHIILNFSIGRMSWLNDIAKELGFRYLLSTEGIPRQTYTSNMYKLMLRYKNDYKKYCNIETLFNTMSDRKKHTMLREKFITEKFKNLLAVKFCVYPKDGLIYQTISKNIVLCDPDNAKPSIMGNTCLSQQVIDEHAIMFEQRTDHYCDICDISFSRGMPIGHVDTQIHKKNEERKKTIERVKTMI